MTTIAAGVERVLGEPEPEFQVFADDGGMTHARFVDENKLAMARKIIEEYRPRYNPAEDRRGLPRLLRRPMGMQEQVIRATAQSLRERRGTNVVGEMGSGKTLVSVVAARMAGFKRVLVLCPPHLTGKWLREIACTLHPSEARTAEAVSVTGLKKLWDSRKEDRDGRTLFVVMSREKAKLSHGWTNSPQWSIPRARGRLIAPDETGEQEWRFRWREGENAREMWENLPRTPVCVKCHRYLVDRKGKMLTRRDIENSRTKLICLNPREDGTEEPCGEPAWQADNGNLTKNRIGLTEYVKKKMPGYFDLMIADEVHEYKAKYTAQGAAAAAGANACGKTLTLTGTFMGGYASTLFHLLYRFSPEFRTGFPYGNGERRWVDRYGFIEQTIRTREVEELQAHGTGSRRKVVYQKTQKEVPGLMPAALFHLVENTAFLRLSDVSRDLPPYEEYVMLSELDGNGGRAGLSQREAYGMLEDRLEQELKRALGQGSHRLLGAYVQSLLAYPDGVTRGERVTDVREDREIINIRPLDRDKVYPKEQSLADLVNRERERGRNVLVYVNHTGTRDITGRVKDILERDGNNVAVLRSDKPKASSREKWIEGKVREGINVLICNPRLVQTGLDLIPFPSVVWFEPEYSVYTMRQASRRSWRIGQTEPVEVYYMAYADTMQSRALRLIAAKVQSSLAVEGELPEEGLSAYGDTEDNLIVALARQVAGSVRDGGDEEQAILDEIRRAREWEYRGGELLAEPEDWRLPDPVPVPETEPEPEPAPRPQRRRAVLTDPEPEPAEEPPQYRRVGRKGQLAMFSLEDYLRKA